MAAAFRTLKPTAGPALSALVVMAGSSAALAQDLSGIAAYGRDIVAARCSNCHSSQPGKSDLAPTLHGLMGRKAGGVAGFPYSEKISRLELVWSPETLKVWLASQSLDSALLRMRHLGVQDPGDADAIIAYLVTLK